MLRAHACVICGDPIPAGRRVDRRYCRTSCRSVAYRARRVGKQTADSQQRESEAAPRPSRYGSIPAEVLEILAKHFGQRDEVVRAELAVAQRRAAELQRALDQTTAPPGLSAEDSQATLAAAQERIRKLTAELARSQAENADKCDKLTTQLETLSRQKQADADAQAKSDEERVTLEEELRSLRAQTEEQAREEAKELAEVQRALEKEQERASQLEAQATELEGRLRKFQDKPAAAEARTRQDADNLNEQPARAAELQARLSKTEKQRQETPAQDPARDRDYDALQQQVRELRAHIARGDAATSQQLASLQAERDLLQAECALHRERAEAETADSVYDHASSGGTQMVRAMLAAEMEPAAVQEHLQRYGFLIWWSARWFVRQFMRALLGSERRLELKDWAMQTIRELQSESRHSPGLFPPGLSSWVDANPLLISQIALCVAGSTATRVTYVMPAEFQAAMKEPDGVSAVPITSREPRSVATAIAVPSPFASEAWPPPPSTHTVRSSARLLEPAEPPPGPLPDSRPSPREKIRPQPMPPPPPSASPPGPSRALASKPPETAAPPAWSEQFKYDRLVGIKQDLLSVSHQLAEVQDIMGRPITAQRLREGANISEQALEEAMAERWSYIHKPPPERKTPVYWVKHGVLLDEESERELRDRATEKFVDLSASLRILEAKRRQKLGGSS